MLPSYSMIAWRMSTTAADAGLAARIQAAATPGEVLVSSTVKDLAAGAGYQFESRGAVGGELKGGSDLRGRMGTVASFSDVFPSSTFAFPPPGRRADKGPPRP